MKRIEDLTCLETELVCVTILWLLYNPDLEMGHTPKLDALLMDLKKRYYAED